jgi:WD40 repeat protein
MSQKAICPRGHIWDPSTLAGLPPTETPRCPICGESEPLRAGNAVGRFLRWCRNNALVATLSALCLLLVVTLAVSIMRARAAAQRADDAAEKAEHEARKAAKALLVRQEGVEVGEENREKIRGAEAEAAKWRQRHDEMKRELREEKEARHNAVLQRDEQARDRRTAEELAQSADQLRREAQSAREQAGRQLVGMNVALGTRLMEDGDLSGSLVWFAEALRLAHREKMPEETHRLRLAAVLAQCPRPVQVWNHEKKLNAVQLAADGKRLLTAGVDGEVVIWDTAGGRRVGEPLAHMAAVTHAVFSANGKRVLTTTADMTVHVWDLDMGKEAFPAIQLMGPVLHLTFSPDGRRFLTIAGKPMMDGAPMPAASDADLHVWDAATGESMSEQALGSDISPRPASFSPDGKQVLTICQDRCARIWDVATEKQVGAAFPHAAALVQASFSADGRHVLTASADGTARVWRAGTGAPRTPLLSHGAALRGAVLDPAGERVLTIGEDRRVRIWEANGGAPVGPPLSHPDTIHLAVFSPDGRYVMTTCADGMPRLWDYTTGEEVVPALRHGGPIAYAAFTPVGDGVLTLAGQVVRLWDLTAAETPAPPEKAHPEEPAFFSPDGRLVLRVSGTSARLYDVAKNQPVGAPLAHKDKISAAAFSADGRRVLTVSHQPNGDELEGHVQVWETATGKPLGEPLVHSRAVLEAAFSADGGRVLTACKDGKARLWDAVKSARVGEEMDHKEDLERALFTPDGRRILTLDAQGGLRLWDVMTAEAVGPTWGHRKPVHHLEFSADGRRLVTAGDDGTATVWEADSGKEVASTTSHGAPVLHAVFSPEGERVATVSADRAVRVWKAADGKPVTPPLHHRAAVRRAAFSADGRWLLTVAADGLHAWDAATGEPVGPPMKLGPEQPDIRSITLAKDGRLVLAAGDPHDPSARWTRSLRADARPANDLLLMAQVLADERPADGGAAVPLGGAELEKAWREARKKYGAEFAPAAERAAAWDRRGAVECEHRRLWVGAVLYLDRLLARAPTVDLFVRRARANTELRRWEAARADYATALAREPERWDLYAGRAAVEAGLGRWKEAEADYSKAIEKKGDRAELWLGRGRAAAERGDWTRAAADLDKAIHLGNEEPAIWTQHALALLAGGDEANYRRACGRLVQRYGRSDDPATARLIAWTCAVKEGSVRDLQPLLRRAERAVNADPQSADELRRLAVLLYRAGRFDTALQRLEELTRLKEGKVEARDRLLMALAAQRLGRNTDAKKWLEMAEEMGREKSASWPDRLVYETLHREAAALIKR